MPTGRYTLLDGVGNPLAIEQFRCAPGPMGWRYFATVLAMRPQARTVTIDLSVDASWRPVRVRIETGEHSLLLARRDGPLTGQRDGLPVEAAAPHVSYPSPGFLVACAYAANGGEIEVVELDAETLEPVPARHAYRSVGQEAVETPAGRFGTERFRASLPGGERSLWIANDVVAACEGLVELAALEPGARGPFALDR